MAVLIAGAVAGGVASPASAAPSTTLVYSVDGGATWASNATVGAGQQVIARLFYNNDTAGAINATEVSTSLPAGFTLVPGSTKVCLNPGTTDPTSPTNELACNTDAGQGGAINEGAVWSGGNLTISPTAGLLTQSPSATSGVLQVGEFRYLNLDQCVYGGSASDTITYLVPSTPNTPPFSAGTTASNATQAVPNCGPGAGGYPLQPVNSGVANVALLGQRYLNLEQCAYDGTAQDLLTEFVPSTPNPGFGAATTASNTQPASPTCEPGSGGYPFQAVNSGVANVDLLGNGTLNLNQCMYYGTVQDGIIYAVPTTPNPGYSAATTASNTSPSAATCGSGSVQFAPQAANSGIANVNLVDPSRGQGFVEFTMTAPSPATSTTEDQTGGLTGNGTGDPTTSGILDVVVTAGAPMIDAAVAAGLAGALSLVAAGWIVARRRHKPTA